MKRNTLRVILLMAMLVAGLSLAGCGGSSSSTSSTSNDHSSNPSTSNTSAQVATPDPEPTPEPDPEPETPKTPYDGKWVIHRTYTNFAQYPYFYLANGYVEVDSSHIDINLTENGETYNFSGPFVEVTDDGMYLYNVGNDVYAGIGKDETGSYTAVVVMPRDAASLDEVLGIYVERAGASVDGCAPFVGDWITEDGSVVVEFTEGGAMFGDDMEGSWMNFYTVNGNILQLVGIPDKFVLEGDALRYEVNGMYLYFYRP